MLDPSLTARDVPGQAQDAPAQAPRGFRDTHLARSALDLAIPIAVVL